MSLKRILQFIILTAILVAVMWGWHTLKDPATLPIKHVIVEASYEHVEREILAEIISPYATEGLFNINVDALEKQLSAMPWVASASIRRIWPDKIVIKIVEQQPVGYWGKTALLNAQGEVFTVAAATLPKELPLTFNGPEGRAAEMWQYYQQMKALLQPLSLTITDIELTARGAWSLTLGNNVKVLLGKTDVIQRLQQFAALYPQLVAPHVETTAVVDMRYNNGVAIVPRKP